jgi:DNA-binding NtrC family response regulator
MPTILCVDDEPAIVKLLDRALSTAGHRVLTAQDVTAALDVVREDSVDLILSDYRMPGLSGLELLHLLSEEGIDTPVVMLTGHDNVETAVRSLKAGAVDYLVKPIRSDQLQLVVNQAIETRRLRKQTNQLSERISKQQPDRTIVGQSGSLKSILDEIPRIAPTRASVMISGESGTGKELIARAIHEASERAKGPFVAINCAALPESLVESVLFGHERGAFTGAVKQVKGVFERAHRGTLLLDEISEMRLDLQAKLLRVLQEREFERVGGGAPIRVDVRVIATTNRDLDTEIQEGRFRGDLYYRLSVVHMHVPALRERRDDIPLLAEHFRKKAAAESGCQVDGFTSEAMELLRNHPWTGNVRELAHAVERAVILARDATIGPDGFRFAGFAAKAPTASRFNGTHSSTGNGTSAASQDAVISLPTLNIVEAERLLIDSALADTNNNRTRAAKLLGISVRTLRNKLNRPDDLQPS